MLPTLTSTPSIAGRFRSTPEDFLVDELPAFLPSGEGDHVYVKIRKRGLTTPEALRRLASALGARHEDAGHAGLKDRHAITTQWVSLFGTTPEAAREVQVEDLEVLEAARHRHKLRAGKLRGNRFTLRVRGVPAAATSELREALDQLAARGVPAYFGTQRFGREGQNRERARRWLVEGGRAPRDRFARKMMVSTLQSQVFNGVLAARLERGLFDRVLAGDVLRKEETGGIFVAEDVAAEQARVDRWETSPTGPLPGLDAATPTGEAATLEAEVAASFDVGPEVLARFGKLGPGARRPLRLRLGDPTLEVAPDELGATTVTLAFDLPAGGYATEVLRELFKDGLEEARPARADDAREHAAAPR